jgi:Flp pilus assembly secretin CpaC
MELRTMIYNLIGNGHSTVVYGLTHAELERLRGGRVIRLNLDGEERAAPGPVLLMTVAADDQQALRVRVEEVRRELGAVREDDIL